MLGVEVDALLRVNSSMKIELTRREVCRLSGMALTGVALETLMGARSSELSRAATEVRMQQESIFDAGKVKINYLDYSSSSDEPLIMLHGGAWRWQEYLTLIPSLSQKRHVYALDLRGNGRSGWTPEHYRLKDFTDDNVEFVKRLNAPAVLAGHSIGGVIGLMVAEQCPEKVKALIIEDSPVSLDNYKRIIESGRDMFGIWLELKRSAKSELELSLALADKFKNYPGITSTWIMFFARCLWLLDPTFFNALLYDFDGFTKGYDCKRILAKIKCPILFIRGEKELGAVMTDDEISWLRQNFSNVSCAQINGVGHLLHLQDQGQAPVLAEMMAFLGRIPK